MDLIKRRRGYENLHSRQAAEASAPLSLLYRLCLTFAQEKEIKPVLCLL